MKYWILHFALIALLATSLTLKKRDTPPPPPPMESIDNGIEKGSVDSLNYPVASSMPIEDVFKWTDYLFEFLIGLGNLTVVFFQMREYSSGKKLPRKKEFFNYLRGQ